MPYSKSTEHTVQEILSQNADGNGKLTVGTSPTPPSSLTSGAKVTAGTTAVQLVASATAARRVTIQAFASNTGIIAVGGSNVLAAGDATAVGIQLTAGDAYELDIDDLSKVWIRATVSGEGVTFVATA